MNAFNHHNRVVHHNSNGQHHSGKGEQVDGEANQIEQEEGTNQGHGDGNGGNQRRAEVLEEDKYYQEHQNKGFDKGLDNLVDRGEEEVVGILCHVDDKTIGKVLLAFVKQHLNVLNNLRSVTTSRLHDHTGHGVVAVHAAGEAVGHTTEFYFGNILQAKHSTVSQRLDDEVLKLARLLQASLVAKGILEGLVFALADRTRSGFDVLLGKDARDVGRHEVVLGHLLGIEPNTHGVVGTHHVGITHTLHTLNLRDEVNLCVVLNEGIVVFILLVHDGEDNQHGGLALLRDDTHAGNFGGQEALGLADAVLHVHGSHIRVSALLEGDGNVC